MGLIKKKWGLALLTFNVISNVLEFMDVWYLSNIFEQSSLLVCPKSMISGLAMFSCVSSKMHDFFSFSCTSDSSANWSMIRGEVCTSHGCLKISADMEGTIISHEAWVSLYRDILWDSYAHFQ